MIILGLVVFPNYPGIVHCSCISLLVKCLTWLLHFPFSRRSMIATQGQQLVSVSESPAPPVSDIKDHIIIKGLDHLGDL